jgi:hypothetical protein
MKRTEIIDSQTHRLVPIKWQIIGHQNYGFAANKRCYNLTTGFEVRQVVKGGYTRGYNLGGKFYSLSRLRPLLRPALYQGGRFSRKFSPYGFKIAAKLWRFFQISKPWP